MRKGSASVRPGSAAAETGNEGQQRMAAKACSCLSSPAAAALVVVLCPAALLPPRHRLPLLRLVQLLLTSCHAMPLLQPAFLYSCRGVLRSTSRGQSQPPGVQCGCSCSVPCAMPACCSLLPSLLWPIMLLAVCHTPVHTSCHALRWLLIAVVAAHEPPTDMAATCCPRPIGLQHNQRAQRRISSSAHHPAAAACHSRSWQPHQQCAAAANGMDSSSSRPRARTGT